MANESVTTQSTPSDATQIFDRLEALGKSQRELAQVIGIEDNKLSKVKAGVRRFSVSEADRARAWLTALEGPDAASIPRPEDEDDDTVIIQELELAYGMGGGSYLDLPVKATPQRLSRGLLRAFTNSPPDRIFVARGMGDSMMPTILDADLVLIDTSDNRVQVGDKIWAIAYGDIGLIKRLRPMPDGSVKILSDNPSVPPETAYEGEINVVGRVVGVLRKT